MNKKKPTIFITASRAIIVRNFFLNEFFSQLANTYNVVIFTTLYKDKDYLEMFGNFTNYELKERTYNTLKRKLEDLFMIFYKGLIYNPTVEVRTKYGLLKRGEVRFKYARYII